MTRQAIIELTRSQGPMTAKQIAAELGLGVGGVRTSILRARQYGTKYLRIAAWARTIPKYGPGPDDDEPHGGTQQRIREHLESAGRATAAQLIQALGCSRLSIAGALRRIRNNPKNGAVRIAGWSRVRGRGGAPAPIYEFGTGSDEPRPDFRHSKRDSERRTRAKSRVLAVMLHRQGDTNFHKQQEQVND